MLHTVRGKKEKFNIFNEESTNEILRFLVQRKSTNDHEYNRIFIFLNKFKATETRLSNKNLPYHLRK